MKASLVVITLFSFIAETHARIGESVRQIEAKYGKPQRVLHERGSFREVGYGYEGFMVGVTYVNGTSKREGFARPDLPKLSDSEIQRLLALSAGRGMSWKPLLVDHSDRYWGRSDGKVVAMLSSAGNFLTVQEKDFLNSSNARLPSVGALTMGQRDCRYGEPNRAEVTADHLL